MNTRFTIEEENIVAIYAEEDLEITIKSATSMIEPIMIVGMGILVGGIASAMLLPIFQMSKMNH